MLIRRRRGGTRRRLWTRGTTVLLTGVRSHCAVRSDKSLLLASYLPPLGPAHRTHPPRPPWTPRPPGQSGVRPALRSRLRRACPHCRPLCTPPPSYPRASVTFGSTVTAQVSPAKRAATPARWAPWRSRAPTHPQAMGTGREHQLSDHHRTRQRIPLGLLGPSRKAIHATFPQRKDFPPARRTGTR